MLRCYSCQAAVPPNSAYCNQCGLVLQQSLGQGSPSFAAQFPHPGPMPKMPRFGGLAHRFSAMGTLAGRTRAEIESVVGPPQSWSGVGPGQQLLQWQHIDAESGYHIALVFDDNGVCGGVTHESSV